MKTKFVLGRLLRHKPQHKVLWCRSWDILGGSWALSGCSWELLGRFWGLLGHARFALGAILGRSCVLSGCSWSAMGAPGCSWGALWVAWGVPGALWGPSGALWGRAWALDLPSRKFWQANGRIGVHPLGILGCSWGVLGAILHGLGWYIGKCFGRWGWPGHARGWLMCARACLRVLELAWVCQGWPGQAGA